jgi:hypothetical protein
LSDTTSVRVPFNVLLLVGLSLHDGSAVASRRTIAEATKYLMAVEMFDE